MIHNSSAHYHSFSYKCLNHLLRKKRLFDTRISYPPLDVPFERFTIPSSLILESFPYLQKQSIFYLCDCLKQKRESLEPKGRFFVKFPFS